VQLWPNLSVAIARMVGQIAEPMFASMLPAPLNSLRFEKIDLGQVPIHISNVDVHQTENNGIKLDLDLDWNGNCDIELNGQMVPKIVSCPFASRLTLFTLISPPGSRACQAQGQVLSSALPVDKHLPLRKYRFQPHPEA